jgi:lysyl-tRNA synthetase class 2
VLGESPWFEIAALGFGIGVGLTIDEFALWVHLDDVYWAEEGRRSIDATVIAVLLMAIIMFGLRPFEIGTDSASALIASLIAAALNLVVAGICFLKDRILHGVIGFFFLPVGLYGAMRLAKPNSAWARRRYGDRCPAKQVLAARRFPADRRTQRFKERFRDIVGGGISQH